MRIDLPLMVSFQFSKLLTLRVPTARPPIYPSPIPLQPTTHLWALPSQLNL